MRWASIICILLSACGDDIGGGGDGGGTPTDPYTAVFLFSEDRNGDTALRGQVAAPGAIGVAQGSGCSNPLPDDPIALASFLPSGSASLLDIADVGLEGFGSFVSARTIDETNHEYGLVQEDVPYPAAGTEISVYAGDDRFAASLVIGEPPTIVAPAPASPFPRTADLAMTIDAPGAAGIVVDMDFPNAARALCFFPAGGDIVFPREAIAGELGPNDDTTFSISGTTFVSVGSWTVGQGGTDGVDVHLVSISTSTIELALQ